MAWTADTTRGPRVGYSNWPRGVCSGRRSVSDSRDPIGTRRLCAAIEIGFSPDRVGTNPFGPRTAIRLADSALLCGDTSEFPAQVPCVRLGFQHDSSLRRCLLVMLGIDVPLDQGKVTRVPPFLGGLGFFTTRAARSKLGKLGRFPWNDPELKLRPLWCVRCKSTANSGPHVAARQGSVRPSKGRSREGSQTNRHIRRRTGGST